MDAEIEKNTIWLGLTFVLSTGTRSFLLVFWLISNC